MAALRTPCETTMGNIRPRLLILIVATIALALVVAWQWSGGGDADAAALRRIEKFANNGDQAALEAEASAKDVTEACRAVRSMGRVGPKALDGIILALKDERPMVREAAAIAVGQAGGESEAPVVSTIVMTDDSPVVRAAAALSLGRMKAYKEIESLLDALADEDEHVRRRANAAVEKIIGAGVSFDASAPEEKRRQQIAELRALWSEMKDRTEEFYQLKKRREQSASKD